MSPSGSDTAACSASAPCKSFARAYTVASSGAVVSVGAGVYGSQFFAGGYGGSQSQGTKTLTFRGEPGNSVRQLHFHSPNLTFDGINVDAGGAQLGDTDGATFENGGEPFTFKNGSIGNVVDQKGAMIDGPGMVFDNVRFHDVVIRTAGVHSECIFASVPEGMIVRNSTFENCAVMDIFFVYPDWWSPLPPVYGNVVLEGNNFGHPDGTYALYIAKIGTSIPSSAPVNGWRIRNNTLGGPVTSTPQSAQATSSAATPAPPQQAGTKPANTRAFESRRRRQRPTRAAVAVRLSRRRAGRARPGSSGRGSSGPTRATSW